MKLSNHSISRGYDRLSIDSDKLLAVSQEALLSGYKKSQFIRGKLKDYLIKRSNDELYDVIVYKSHIFIFTKEIIQKLITFYKLPKRFTKIINHHLKENEIVKKRRNAGMDLQQFVEDGNLIGINPKEIINEEKI